MLIVLCPCCGNKEALPDGSAGRRRICSNCGTPFLVGSAPPPVATEEPAEEVIELVPIEKAPPSHKRSPPPRRRRERRPPEDEPDVFVPPVSEPPRRARRGASLVLGLGAFLIVLLCGGIVGGSIWWLRPDLFGNEPVAENTEKERDSTEKKPAPQETKFVDLGKPAFAGGVRITITSATIEFVAGTAGDNRFKSEDKLLAIKVRIENNSGEKKVDYIGWGGAVPVPITKTPRLTDDAGNTYKLVTFTGERHADGQIRTKAIEPHRGIHDLLVFEPPADEADMLKLELPARNFGGTGKIGFQVPRSKIHTAESSETDNATPVPDLIESLKDPDPVERLSAARTLAVRGPAAARAAKPLGDTLKDADPVIRKTAAEVLARIGLTAHDAYPALVRALGDDNEAVRTAARAALGKVGPAVRDDVAELTAAVNDAHPTVRAFALETLLSMELEPAQATPIYTAALKAEDRAMRIQATRALGKVGPKGREAAFPALMAAMRDADAEVRREAEQAIAKLGPPPAGDVPGLRKLLKEMEAPAALRAQAARSLGALGAAGKDAVSDLAAALQDPELVVRRAAAGALAKMGPAVKESLVWLIAALRDKDSEVRLVGLEAVGKLGIDGKLASAEVSALVADSDPGVRKAAGRVLVLIDASAAGRAFARALFSRDEAVRLEAAEVLFQMGAEAKAYTADLITALSDKSPVVRLKAARTLTIIDPNTTAPVNILAELMSSPHAATRREASEALALIGAVAEDAVPALTKALKDSEPAVRRNALTALDKLGAKARPALMELIAALQDRKLHEPIAAVVVKIGADSAVKPLGKALGNEDPAVRLGAVHALRQFGAEAAGEETALGKAIAIEKDDEIKKAMRDLMKQIKMKG